MSRNPIDDINNQSENQRLERGMYYGPDRAKEERDYMRWGDEGFDEIPSGLCQFCYVDNGVEVLCKEHRHDE